MPTENERDFNVDIGESVAAKTDNVQLPLNFVTNGEVENDDIKVYIHQSTYRAIERFAKSDTTRELGSILLGDYSEYSNRVHVVISEYIEAKHTDASASTLTFTHETWEYIHKEHEHLYPDLKILGWQHTHPNYGIFLSEHDMFIQDNFFNLPYQVAYVVDPRQNTRGFFQWKNGKVEKLKGYYIYDEVGKKISVETKTPKPMIEPDAKPSRKATFLLLSLLLVVAAMSVSLFAVLHSNMGKQADRQDELAAMIVAQNQDINLDEVQGLMEKVENQQAKIDEQEKTIAELRELIGSSSDGQTPTNGEGVVFTYYTVEYGETLTGICSKLNIDYQANADIIKAVNGIDDPSRISIGQTLLLPKKIKSPVE